MRIPGSAAALLLLLALFLALLGLGAVSFWQGYQDALRRAEASAFTASRAVASHAQWLVESSQQVLARVDSAVDAEALAVTVATPTDIDPILGDLPQGLHIRIFGRSGNQLFSSDPSQGAIDVSTRPYFQELAAGARRVVSFMLVDALTDAPGFVIGRRLERNGEFVGAAAAFVPNDLLSAYWETLSLGVDSTVSIFRDDGQLVARHPPLSAPLDLSSHPLFAEHLRGSDHGVYRSQGSPADNIARLVGFSRVQVAPLVAVAAVSEETALVRFWERLERTLLIAVPVVVILLIFAVWVLRLLKIEARSRSELQESARYSRLLLKEVHHRVKNNLQTIASLVRMQPMPEEVRRDLSNRVAAMAGVHDQLHRRENQGAVDLAEYLPPLLSAVNAEFGSRVDLQVAVSSALVSADDATALGLIANELITNTNKYAFPEGQAGQLSVSVTAVEPGWADIRFRNNGVPFDASPESRAAGVRMVRSLARQVNPDFILDGAEGLDFRITAMTMTNPLQDAAA